MRNLAGGILLAIGILIAGASGLCSLVALGSSLNQLASMLPLVLIFGGIPLAIGVGLILLGRAVLRTGKSQDVGDDPPRP
ncbi:MAG TPA: hypothetical protein VJ859_03980 [Allosphingosinicella sp.]|nr:hypothetical protein [Allosphingosinicella sp.]